MKHMPVGVAAVLLAAPLMLSGCGEREPKLVASQVVVKVGESEISVHQLNAVLARLPPMDAAALEGKKAEIIHSMVDQQVAADQATKQKLDRTPDAVILLEAAREQMLSQLYFADYAQQIARPAVGEAEKFYRENPNLYSKRRKLLLTHLTVGSASADLVAKITAQARPGHQIAVVSAELSSEGVPHAYEIIRKKTDEFAPELAAKIGALDVGQLAVLPEKEGNLELFEIKEAEPDPVDFDTAEAAISQLLYTTKAQLALPDQLKRLVQTTEIEYVGDFAKYAPSATPQDQSK